MLATASTAVPSVTMDTSVMRRLWMNAWQHSRMRAKPSVGRAACDAASAILAQAVKAAAQAQLMDEEVSIPPVEESQTRRMSGIAQDKTLKECAMVNDHGAQRTHPRPRSVNCLVLAQIAQADGNGRLYHKLRSHCRPMCKTQIVAHDEREKKPQIYCTRRDASSSMA